MKELLITWIYTNPAKVATIVAISTIMLAVIALDEPDLTPKQMEEKLKQEITNLDTKRDSKLNDLQKEVDALVKCRENITKDKGTAEPLKECAEYKESIIPEAQAMEVTNTGTATGAINPVPKYPEVKNETFRILLSHLEGIKAPTDEILMERICAVAPNSPLCGKWELYFSLKKITEDRLPPAKYGRMWEILLGISFAESHLGQNYAKDNQGGTCYGRNNFGGTKYQINDDNTRVHSRQLNGFNYGAKYHWRYTDQYGCNLFPFQTVEEYWITKVNGMRFGYPTCILNNTKPITCLAYKYVGNPNVAEPNWIKNVSSFLVNDKQNVGQP